MDVLKSLRVTMNVLGFAEGKKEVGVYTYPFLAVYIINFINIIYFIANKWDDVEDRFYSLKATPFFTISSSYLILFNFCWAEFLAMFGLLDRPYYEHPFEASPGRENLYRSLEATMRKSNRFWSTMIVTYATTTTVVPLAVVLIKVILFYDDFQKVIKENLSTPLPLYFPQIVERFENLESCWNVAVYMIGYVLHTIYTVFFCLFAHLAYVTTLCTMTNVEYQLKILRLSLSEMDDTVHVVTHTSSSKICVSSLEDALDRFMKYFVKHHQETLRRFNIVNRGIKWVAATLSATASLYLCMSIYTIVQREKIIWKIQEALFLMLWAYAVFFIDASGERIKTEGEELRKALYDCNWVDKPRWFRKSLLIPMIRSCRSIDLKPFGLITLNLSSFAMTMKAAYSYYNLLYSFHSE